MQFLVLAYDATDSGALDRRMKVRDAHIASMDRYKKSGHMHMGAALLDDAGKMIGSVIITDFPSRKEFDDWLAEEPYVIGKVWENIQVTPCKLGPSFAKG